MSTNLRIDGGRLTSRLAELSKIGATPEGGCRRLALTDEDRQGRDWLVGQMKALGLDVRVDAIGNIVGILKGLEDGPAVVMGSHIDTVGTGGRFDGALGVVAGVEVLAALRDAGLTPKRDMAVIAFTNEEGARFQPDMLGSYVWAGGMSVEAAYELALWQHLAMWLPITILGSLALLQPIKGAVVGLQWANYMHGFGGEKDVIESHPES